MKQLLTSILLTLMAVVHAQTITWEQTGIKVPAGNVDAVVTLIDEFYSSIDFPEGVSLELSAVSFSGESQKATHYLQYSGTSEGLAVMRTLREGTEYDLYTAKLSTLCEIVSAQSGKGLIRYNIDKGEGKISQLWTFSVKDAEKFAKAFVTLNESFSPKGYVSLGQTLHGNENGESHYIYTVYDTYQDALDFGPTSETEAAAFSKFLKTLGTVSDYLRSTTQYTVKTWN